MARQYSPTDDLRELRAIFSSDSELSAHERSVLAVLILHRNGETGQLDPSLSTITQEASIGRSTTSRVLAALEASGWIQRDRGRDGHSRTSYRITPTSPRVRLVPQRDQSQSGTRLVPQRDQTSPTAGHERTKERTKERTGVFPPLSEVPRQGHRRLYPPEFEGAFRALPARAPAHAKADAYRAWRSQAQEVGEVFQLEAAADAYREECDQREVTGTQYVMQAATFFGPGERWEPYSGVEPVVLVELRRFGDSAARFVQ